VTDPADIGLSSRSLAALAQQLREGPLQNLTELHRKTALVSASAPASHDQRLAQLTELALLSLATMEHFQAFTRELRAHIADLVSAPGRDVH
jgi:hypothetical protein